jgi:4-carboxymuconolactone decarboxylase
MPAADAHPRLAKLPPAELDERQRALYDDIAGGRRREGPQAFRLVDDEGRLEGPFNAFLLQPALGSAWQALGAAVRYDTALPDRSREIAILVVAATWDCAFERHAHEAHGRAVGLTDAELAAVRTSTYDVLPATAERVVARTVAALARRGDLDDTEYAEVVAAVGLPATFELLTLVGYYAALALQLRVFRVATPNG